MEIKRLEDFIKYMPEDVSDIISKARYLYLELGKRSFYDPEYKYFMFGDAEENLVYINKPYSNPNVIICTTLAKQYKQLLDLARIQNTIEFDSGDHGYNNFTDENGVEHKTDLTQDLKNIQFGCSTNYFAVDTILPDELRKIDVNLGYITEKIGYSNEHWNIIRDAIQDERLSPKQRLELIFANLHRIGDPQKPGITELFSMYQKFIRYAMPDTDLLSIYSMKRNRFEQEKCVIELIDGENKIEYVLNPKTRKFEETKGRNSNKNRASKNNISISQSDDER